MEQLRAQVRRARWRLGLQRFVAALGWCWFAAGTVAVALVAIGQHRPLGVPAWAWGIAATGAGLAGAVVWAVVRGRGALDAAIEIDRRFGLKERVSSALALSGDERQSDVGRALLQDAARRIERIDVHERFPVAPGRPLLLPLLPAAAAALIAWLITPAVMEGPASANSSARATRQIKQSGESLKQNLLEQRKRAETEGLKDAQRLFERLEQEAADLAERTQGDRKQALVKLNDLYQQMEKRREQIKGAESVQKQLELLKDLSQGPADKFLQAVAQGDLKQAVEELEKLKSKIEAANLSSDDKEQLVDQLQQLERKLQESLQQQRQTQQDLQNRIEQARAAGQNGLADKLQQQLDDLKEQMSESRQLQDLADKLGQCAQSLSQGNLKDAAGMLDQIQGDVENLQEQLQEMEMLQGAMDQLGQARDQMNCENCGGAGCELCQPDKPAMGLGPGRGQGDRPEEKTDVGFYDTKTQQKVGRGAASVVGKVEGPNVKGNIQQELQAELQAARTQAVDPLTGQRLPREHRQHATEYFDRFREGK